eukprot:Gb_13582 [translate_table: standard]
MSALRIITNDCEEALDEVKVLQKGEEEYKGWIALLEEQVRHGLTDSRIRNTVEKENSRLKEEVTILGQLLNQAIELGLYMMDCGLSANVYALVQLERFLNMQLRSLTSEAPLLKNDIENVKAFWNIALLDNRNLVVEMYVVGVLLPDLAHYNPNFLMEAKTQMEVQAIIGARARCQELTEELRHREPYTDMTYRHALRRCELMAEHMRNLRNAWIRMSFFLDPLIMLFPTMDDHILRVPVWITNDLQKICQLTKEEFLEWMKQEVERGEVARVELQRSNVVARAAKSSTRRECKGLKKRLPLKHRVQRLSLSFSAFLDESVKRRHLVVRGHKWFIAKITCTSGASKVVTCTSGTSKQPLASRVHVMKGRDLVNWIDVTQPKYAVKVCGREPKTKTMLVELTCNFVMVAYKVAFRQLTEATCNQSASRFVMVNELILMLRFMTRFPMHSEL